jgi:thiol-disulfide isomerase/thioredoxin
MPWEKTRIRAPEFVGEQWLNTGERQTLAALLARGPVLVDFWDYTCVNCLRTLPYLIEWYERYAPLGLTVVGVHTPEFAFAQQVAAVAAAVERLGLPYPVLLDSGQANWSAYATRAWPSKFLVDQQRIIRYSAVGEGRYGEMEAAIQTLLREQHGADIQLPALLKPLRPTDAPGAVCYRTTPELYGGYAHGRLGNEGDFGIEAVRDFAAVAVRDEGKLYFEGPWYGSQEFSESAGEDSRLRLAYRAAEINAVLATADGTPQKLFLLHDGKPLTMGEAGEDVVLDSELGSYVTVRAPRMYNLVINPDFARHELTLEPAAPGLRLYAFSFVSCTKPTREEGDVVIP